IMNCQVACRSASVEAVATASVMPREIGASAEPAEARCLTRSDSLTTPSMGPSLSHTTSRPIPPSEKAAAARRMDCAGPIALNRVRMLLARVLTIIPTPSSHRPRQPCLERGGRQDGLPHGDQGALLEVHTEVIRRRIADHQPVVVTG